VEQEQLDIDCIYDFIYLDSKRLTSYLAQLNDDGVLLSIKKTKHISEDQKNIGSAGLNNATKVATEHNETISKNAERHYDSSSTALYSVIDKLDELGFVQREIENTAIGQMLLCSGSISFQDIRMMRDLWEPIMKLSLSQGSSQNKKGSQRNKQKQEADILKTLLSALPHALLMTLFSQNESLWSSLDEEHLTMNSDDITLKHGSNFAGKWYVLGILDAKPDNKMESLPVSRVVNNELFDGMVEMASAIRKFLGRPMESYGITPVAIFRTVS